MWDNIGQVKSDNYSVLFLPDFYRYFGAPLKMREHMYVHICMYICICIYVYICMYVPIRSDAPIRSDPDDPFRSCKVTKPNNCSGFNLPAGSRSKKKGSSKAPLFPPTILATIGNLSNRCNYLFDTQDHPRSSLRSLHQPSRCFLVYLDNSFLPPILSFNLFPVTFPIGSVFLLG